MAFAIGLVASLAACNSAAPPSVVGHYTYAVFRGTVHFRGELRVDGEFTDTISGRQETCAEYALGVGPASTLWVTPTPNNAEPVSGHTIMVTAGVVGAGTNFHGPGTYIEPKAQVDDVEIDNSSFLSGDSPATMITVAADASGKMVFAGLVDTYNNLGESGSETWTCSDGTTAALSVTASPAPTGVSNKAPMLSGSVSISGAYASQGRFTTYAQIDTSGQPSASPGAYTCADYAHGSTDPSYTSLSFVAPEFKTSGDSAGDSAVGFSTILPSGYSGPGTYKSASFPALLGFAAITIPPASAPQFDTFTSRYAGSTVLTVRADGSGSVEFNDWKSNGSDSVISGSVTWTCAARK